MTTAPTVLPGLHLRVDLADGSHADVRVINPDRIRFDLTRQREGWPSFGDAPFIGLTFLAWAALRRADQTEGTERAGTWEQFSGERCLDVTELAGVDSDVRPTPPAPAAGS